jgi:hypothetical protein
MHAPFVAFPRQIAIPCARFAEIFYQKISLKNASFIIAPCVPAEKSHPINRHCPFFERLIALRYKSTSENEFVSLVTFMHICPR